MRSPDPTHRFDALRQGLEAAGFVILDAISAGKRTDIAVGSAGDPFWNAFSVSKEWTENYDDPIDRYTARQINSLLRADNGEEAIYPFDKDAPNFVQLWPATFICVVVTTIGALRSFDLVHVMTVGGQKSEVLARLMYEVGFGENGGNYGYGATISVILFLIMLVFIIFFVSNMVRQADD